MYGLIMHFARMDSPADRLRKARTAAGYETSTDAARAFGWPLPTYQSHENGHRGIPVKAAARYAKAFRVSPGWIVTGEGPRERQGQTVPLVGRVGAGAEVHLVEGDVSSSRIDDVDAPPDANQHTVAVIVEGTSMDPVFRDRDMIYYDNKPGDPEDLIGRECVVKLSDGRVFVKILMRGSERGLYNLFSYNAPLISDVAIEWAVQVIWVRRHR